MIENGVAEGDITLIHDPGTTGNFELKVGETLFHSKKTMGDGKALTEEKLAAILAAYKQ